MSGPGLCGRQAGIDPLDQIMIARVGNPEGRSVMPEAVAGVLGGKVAASGPVARRASNLPPPRLWPSCPFVVYGAAAGAREVEAAARAMRRGWRPCFVSCRTFRLDARHREAWRVVVMDFNEPDYDREALRRIVGNPNERAALMGWLVDGAMRSLRGGCTMPDSVMRATAEAVQ